jgi:hypothetical protein
MYDDFAVGFRAIQLALAPLIPNEEASVATCLRDMLDFLYYH